MLTYECVYIYIYAHMIIYIYMHCVVDFRTLVGQDETIWNLWTCFGDRPVSAYFMGSWPAIVFRRSKEYSILVLDVSVHGKYHQDPLRKLLGKGCFESNSIANVEVYCGRFIYEFLHVCNPILLCQLCNHKTMHGFFVWVHCEPTGHSGSTLQCPEEAMPNGSEPSDHIPVFVSWSKHA